jgi:hypothetical protein
MNCLVKIPQPFGWIGGASSGIAYVVVAARYAKIAQQTNLSRLDESVIRNTLGHTDLAGNSSGTTPMVSRFGLDTSDTLTVHSFWCGGTVNTKKGPFK